MFYLDGRLNGTFSHPNILAFYVLLVITMVLYVLKTGILKLTVAKKVMLNFYLVLLMIILVLTQTRSAWISCAMLFFLYGVLKEKKMLIFLFLGVLLLTATPQVQSRLKDLTEGTGARKHEKLNSMAWRVRLWQSAYPLMLQKPVLGYGLGTFQDYSIDFFPLANWKGSPAHNVFVEAIFETGFVGLLSYLAIFGWMLKALYKRMRSSVGAFSREAVIAIVCIVSYLISCYADNLNYYLAFNWYFYFFIGLILAGINLKTKPKPEETNF